MNKIRIISIVFCIGLLIAPLQNIRSMALLPFVTTITGSSLFAPTLAVTALAGLFAYGKWREKKIEHIDINVTDIQGRVVGLERTMNERVVPGLNDLQTNAARKADVESLQTGMNARFTHAATANTQQFSAVHQEMSEQEKRLLAALTKEGHAINDFTRQQIDVLQKVITTDQAATKGELTKLRELMENFQKENVAAQQAQAQRDVAMAEHTQAIKTFKEQQDTLITQNVQILSFFEHLKTGGINVTVNQGARRQLPMPMFMGWPFSHIMPPSAQQEITSSTSTSVSSEALTPYSSSGFQPGKQEKIYSLEDCERALTPVGLQSSPTGGASTALVVASLPFTDR